MGKIGEKIKLSSKKSYATSLQSVRTGEAGLNEHRTNMLNRVPESGNWTNFKKDSLTTKDIAFLSAYTGHEFAILRGKHTDILFHGMERHCIFDDDLVELLKSGKLELVAHSHPDAERIVPSKDDRDFLKKIGQKESCIVSYITGKENTFTANMFDDLFS